MLPLPFQEFVVAALRPVGVFVADAGPRLIDRAAAGLEVDEHADAAVDLVFLVPQDLLAFHDLREAAAGGLDVDAEVFREAGQVPLFNDDPVVTAAVRRALR